MACLELLSELRHIAMVRISAWDASQCDQPSFERRQLFILQQLFTASDRTQYNASSQRLINSSHGDKNKLTIMLTSAV
ncbi:Hypothetical protein NTJ_10855 [Nesidiocoris tenuis]|uniref:Uncharacterized protein n=1 Tax=Nesidiocoris tenuis TaxID=355587 RepID=A0ABN7B4D3_9HEMI|nr:Hypothetical protein NTJ_10855 [Nesidiocoris tenuis]